MNEIFDMECKIHRMEDKLLRSKNFDEQIQMRSILQVWRMKLQKMKWKEVSNRALC